jgi:hypothetical protein
MIYSRLFFKLLSTLFLLVILTTPGLTASAGLLDSIKNPFQTTKPKGVIKEIKNQSEIEKSEKESAQTKICEIRKGYITKHFASRQDLRTKEIDMVLSKINKIKSFFVDYKQDLPEQSSIISNLTKLLSQKKAALASRVQKADQITCNNSEPQESKDSIRQDNELINMTDKEIAKLQRDFTFEVRKNIKLLKAKQISNEKKEL